MGRKRKAPEPLPVPIPLSNGILVGGIDANGASTTQHFREDPSPKKQCRQILPSFPGVEDSQSLEYDSMPGFDEDHGTTPEPKSTGKKPSEVNEEFLGTWAQTFLDILHSRYYHTDIGEACSKCHGEDAVYRCTECFHAKMLCPSCMADAHRQDPFHIIERWTGSYFEKASLSDASLVIYLGHNGLRCQSSKRTVVEMVCVHTTGTQSCKVEFCGCNYLSTYKPAPRPSQLLQAGLWPATFKQPRTVFTLPLLRLFHHLSVRAKVTAYDYWAVLQRLSNNAFQGQVPDRYRELLRASRYWDYLQALRWHGQSASNCLGPGSLVLQCPSCPLIGINMDPGWDNAPPDEMYLHALRYAKDGNFSSSLHNKPMDKDDRPLTHGAAFFANESDYQKWLEDCPQNAKAETSTCSSFKALTNQYSGKVVAGLVALACARSGMIMAGGVVDLPKGERYCSVDFAKVSATRAFVQLLLWYEYYDIVCQYIINFDKRMLDFPGAPVFPKTHHLIGAYHLPGHVKPECKTKHNGHFVPGTGHTDGEDLERVWSVQNAIARSTREMGPGHRHDALNVHMADYNAQKVFKQASLAVKRYKRIQERFESDQANLEGMERSLTECGAPLEDWRKQERAWLKKVNDPNWRREDITNPYEPQEDKAPTQKQALAELNRENERDRAANGTTSEPTHRLGRLMKFAMDIEQKQCMLYFHMNLGVLTAFDRGKIHAQLSEYKVKKSDSVYNEIELLRQRLADDVQEWEALYEDSLGQIVEELDMLPRFATTTWPAMASLQRCDPEDVSLPVPSQYPLSVRCCTEFAKAIRTERVLREGHANDLIRDIKKSSAMRGFIWRSTKDTTGQNSKTRNGQVLSNTSSRLEALRQEYERTRLILMDLGSDKHNYRPIRPDDCYAPTVYHGARAKNRKGKGGANEESWIWHMGSFRTSTTVAAADEWLMEYDRVCWFRQRAALARSTEQKNLLEVEMRRTQRTFRTWSHQWKAKADNLLLSSDPVDKGRWSYVSKQANMWRRLFDEARLLFPEEQRRSFDTDD